MTSPKKALQILVGALTAFVFAVIILQVKFLNEGYRPHNVLVLFAMMCLFFLLMTMEVILSSIKEDKILEINWPDLPEKYQHVADVYFYYTHVLKLSHPISELKIIKQIENDVDQAVWDGKLNDSLPEE